jgi:hypothetical protein
MQLKLQDLQTFEAYKKASRAAASQIKDNTPFCIFSDVQLPDSSKKVHLLRPFLVVGSPANAITPLLKNLHGTKKPICGGLCSLQGGKIYLVAKSGAVNYGPFKTQASLFRELLGKEILIPAPGGTAAPKAADPKTVQQHAGMTEAAVHWISTRTMVDARVNQLKQAVKGHYAKRPKVLQEIDKIMVTVDNALGNLDHRLADSLKAAAAANPAAREGELRKAKVILTEYKRTVQSDPLITQIDKNPFGVKTNLKQTLMESLTKAEQSMA